MFQYDLSNLGSSLRNTTIPVNGFAGCIVDSPRNDVYGWRNVDQSPSVVHLFDADLFDLTEVVGLAQGEIRVSSAAIDSVGGHIYMSVNNNPGIVVHLDIAATPFVELDSLRLGAGVANLNFIKIDPATNGASVAANTLGGQDLMVDVNIPFQCPDNCNGHAVQCNFGTCVCLPEFSGLTCNFPACVPPSCIPGQSVCVEGSCVCLPNFGGASCTVEQCPNNCSNSENVRFSLAIVLLLCGCVCVRKHVTIQLL